MKIFKTKGNNLSETIKSILPNESVMRTFEVLPLDHKVNNIASAKLLVTPKYILVNFDNVLEVYDIQDLSFEFNSVAPNFKIQDILMEGNFDLNRSHEQIVGDIRRTENRTVFSFYEEKAVSKEFIFRNGLKLETNFRTWAMGQAITNTSKGINNRGVDEMLQGYFSTSDPKVVSKAIVVFLGYLVTKVIFLNFLPQILNTGIDILFIGFLGYICYTLSLTVVKNLLRYEAVYKSYRN